VKKIHWIKNDNWFNIIAGGCMKQLVLAFIFSVCNLMATELPVKVVVLYKHGVGYFERSGELVGGETARLDFEESQMNDVLKSLMVSEVGGAKITSLRYDASEPLSHKLSVFPFQLGQQAPLSALLDSLKGAKLAVHLGSEIISGAIVGSRLVPGDEKHPQRDVVTLLASSGELRIVDLSAATSLKLSDPELQNQLQDYLAAIHTSHSREKRSVYIASSNRYAGKIQVSYVIPAPVWKSSYRLLLSGSGTATLEGWAIVDNLSGEDWVNVRLSLVSGRPISFISRLYEPRYVSRPMAELPEERAGKPVVYGGTMEGEKAPVVAGMAVSPDQTPGTARDAAGSADTLTRGMLSAQRRVPTRQAEAPLSSVEPEALAREVGELLEYSFSTPVTVPRNESAMLPFIQQKITARKLLIYASTNSQYPISAAEILNDTGKTLDGGPVTVFDQGAYAGEALMETVKTSDKRLIGYAVDFGTRVSTTFDSKTDLVREVHSRRGVLSIKKAIQEVRTYTIRNVDEKPKTLLVEHPAKPEYKLVQPKPLEKTVNAYRFEVKLEPRVTEKLQVIEERVYESSVSVSSMAPDVLFSYVTNREISEAVRKHLERIAMQKQRIAETDRSLVQVDQEIKDLIQDQDRLRQNIVSLHQVSGQQEQVENYARQLAAGEARLGGLRGHRAELRTKKAELESELNALIEKVEF